MNNLQDFFSSFPNEFQRPNRYVCQISIPLGLAQAIATDDAQNNAGQSAVSQTISRLLQGLLVDTAHLPNRQFGMIDLAMYGLTEHFPFHAEYTTLKCTFLLPLSESGATGDTQPDNPVLRFFNYWHDQIQDNESGPSAGLDFGFPSDYYATIQLTMFDRQNKGAITYQFDNAYPKLIDTIQVSWAENDKFATLPVEFVFSYWTILSEAASAANSLGPPAIFSPPGPAVSTRVSLAQPGGITIGLTFGPVTIGATII